MITGVGLTVIVNVIGALVQLTPPFVYVAVTVNTELIGALPALVAINVGTPPTPMVGIAPIGTLVRVQLKTTPGTLLVKLIAGTLAPAQYV